MNESQELQQLIDAAKGGDRAAFDRLAGRMQGRLEALIRSRIGRRLRESVEIEDLIQETYLRAFRSIQSFADGGDDGFFRWLGGISGHIIQEAARRTKREVILCLEEDVASSGPSPSRAASRQERFQRLESALSRLSPDHRQAILLARVQRLPMVEVARRLNRSPEAASQLLWRALGKLREIFGSTDSFTLPDRSLDGAAGGAPGEPAREET